MLDLTIHRMAQIMNVIQFEADAKHRMRQSELEWQVKTLAGVIGASVENDGLRKSVLKIVDSINLTGDDDWEETSETLPADTGVARGERSLEDIMENGSVQEALAKNNRRKGPGLPFMN